MQILNGCQSFFGSKEFGGMSGATGRTEPRRYSEEESGKEKLEK